MSSIKEQRENLKSKIELLIKKEKLLAAKEKQQARKARTKRLIEIGAIVESKFSAAAIESLRNIKKEKLEKVDIFLCQQREQQAE